MALENSVVGVLRKELEAAGWYVRLMQWRGRRGAPDLFAAKGGRTVIPEFKRDDGKGEVAALQAREHRLMRAQGVECPVIDSIELGRKIFGL